MLAGVGMTTGLRRRTRGGGKSRKRKEWKERREGKEGIGEGSAETILKKRREEGKKE